jgi:lipopolysaccharide export system protein LptC
MIMFSKEQMNRPLFEELTPQHERSDEWSSVPSFVVGGMANLNYQHLGQQYFDAAHVLAEHIKNREYLADYQLSNPILYLYRHSIELFLNAILRDAAKTHDLSTLAVEYQEFVKSKFASDVPDWVVNRMKELSEIDPNSTAFRYNKVYHKISKSDVPVSGEYNVDLSHLQSAMLALNTALVGVIAAVACGEGKTTI